MLLRRRDCLNPLTDEATEQSEVRLDAVGSHALLQKRKAEVFLDF